jgi:group I intron endonuclease
MSCIYKILNKVNGKVYIGLTSRASPTKRWQRHISDLNSGKHHSRHLQKSWNKYGEANFIFEILEVLEVDIKNLFLREIFWIKFYKSFDPKFGYNMTFGGEGGFHLKETIDRIAMKNRGKKRTLEYRRRVSLSKIGKSTSLKGRKLSPRSIEIKNKISKSKIGIKNPKSYKKIVSVNIFTKTVDFFESVTDASYFAKTETSLVSKSCKKGSLCKDHLFFYKDIFDKTDINCIFEKCENLVIKINKIGRFAHEGKNNHKSKQVIDIKTKIVYENIKKASEQLNINYFSLKSRICGSDKPKGRIVFLQDYIENPACFSLIDDSQDEFYNGKLVVDITTGFIWDSAKEASEIYNIKYSSLKSMLNGRRKNNTNLKYI